MIRFRDYSIKTKLSILAVASSAIALGAVLPRIREQRRADDQGRQSRRMPGAGQHVGFNSTAVLRSHDTQAAHACSIRWNRSRRSTTPPCWTRTARSSPPTTKTRNRRPARPISAGEGYAFTARAVWNSGIRSSTPATRRARCCSGRI